MKVLLERINDNYLFEVSNSNGHRVLLDNKSKNEGAISFCFIILSIPLPNETITKSDGEAPRNVPRK